MRAEHAKQGIVAILGAVLALALLAAPAQAAKTLSVDDVSVAEPDGSATVTATFTVEVSKRPKKAVKADYLTAPDTATGGSDFVHTGGVVKIRKRQRRATVDVTVNGDNVFEGDETFQLQLANPRRAQIADGTGVGTIQDNDPQPPPELATFTLSESCVDAGQTGVSVGTVTLDGPAQGNTFVPVTSGDLGVVTVNGGGATIQNGQISAPVLVDAIAAGSTQLTATLVAKQLEQPIEVDDPCPDPRLVLNEVDYDQGSGADQEEFIEVLNVGTVGVNLATVAIVLFDGQNGGPATEYRRIALGPAGTLAPGDYVVARAPTVPVPGGTASIVFDDDSRIQDGVRDGMALFDTQTLTVFDALSYENGGANGAITQAQPNPPGPASMDLTESGTPTPGAADDLSSGTSAVARIPNGADTNVPADDWKLAFPTPGAANTVMNETDLPAEADYCNIQFPQNLIVESGDPVTIFGRVIESPLTDPPAADPAVEMQVGYGPEGTDPRRPAGWTWADATFNSQDEDEDEYQGTFTAPAAGSYRYAYRVTFDGANYTYCDTNGAGAQPGLEFSPDLAGTMTVTAP